MFLVKMVFNPQLPPWPATKFMSFGVVYQVDVETPNYEPTRIICDLC